MYLTFWGAQELLYFIGQLHKKGYFQDLTDDCMLW